MAKLVGQGCGPWIAINMQQMPMQQNDEEVQKWRARKLTPEPIPRPARYLAAPIAKGLLDVFIPDDIPVWVLDPRAMPAA